MKTESDPKHTHRFWVPYVVLAVGLLCTAAFAWYAHSTTKSHAWQRFANVVEHTHGAIAERLNIYITLLHGTRGIFGMHPSVRREEFRTYVDTLHLRTSYPGIQGIGFALRVTPEDKTALTQLIHGQATFRIWPEQPADAYPIIYLEPLDWRNQRAIGYDMYTEPVRHAAMAQARDTGEPAASGKVTLVQETDENTQAGFLIYLPVYRGGIVPSTSQGRAATLLGFVYSPFRADDLFRGIFGAQAHPGVLFQVFDGTALTADHLLHVSSRDQGSVNTGVEFTATRTLTVAGRTWSIVFSPEPGFAGGALLNPALLIIAMGGAISVLLFVMTRVQSLAHAAVERHAADVRQSQTAVLESEARKRAIVECALDCVITIDHEGKVVEFNPAAEKTFGYQKSQVIGASLAELVVPPALRDQHRQGLIRYLATGASTIIGRRIEITAMRADGTEFPVELAITRIDLQEQLLFTAYVHDITERKEAEKQLAQARQFRDTVMESAVFGLGALDLAGRFTLVNEHFADMMGYTIAELIGQPYSIVLSPENAATLAPHFARVVGERGRLTDQEIEVVRRDGSTAFVIFSWSPLLMDDEVIGLVGTVLDISAPKRAEAEIRRLNEELEQRVQRRTALLESANRELEAFSYSVSHDLRAPLRHIDGFANLLQKHLSTVDATGQRYLQTICDAAKRMGTLIDDLLAFSRMGRAELRQTTVQLGSLVEEVIAGLQSETQQRNIVWHTRPLPEAYGDPALLRQVFMNLMANAVKYTRVRDPAHIEIGCASDTEAEVVVFIRDNGVGFDMQYVDKLFGVFQRLHRVDEFEGTGIGLANVRRIITRHGGRTWAEGQLHVGATFYFSLPKSRPT